MMQSIVYNAGQSTCSLLLFLPDNISGKICVSESQLDTHLIFADPSIRVDH